MMIEKRKIPELIQKIEESESDNFLHLAKIAGLDPGTHFRYANLVGVNFSGLDLSGFNFTGAKLTDCRFKGSRIERAIFDEGLAPA